MNTKIEHIFPKFIVKFMQENYYFGNVNFHYLIWGGGQKDE